MENRNYYAIIPAEIRYDKELSPNAKLLYGEITSLCNEKGICWASNKYFADLYSTSKETISRWISQLAKKGYIFIKIFYKQESKQVDKRIISINNFRNNTPIDENVNTYYQNCQDLDVLTKTSTPYPQNCQEGIDENVKENNKILNKKEEEERDLKKELKEVVDFYENNITMITPFIAEDMEKYLEDGLYSDLIIEAMKEAVSRNKKNWKYVIGILNDCIHNNIITSKQFKIKQEEFKSNKNQTIKKQKKEEKVEYEEVHFENEEDYRKKLFEKQKG